MLSLRRISKKVLLTLLALALVATAVIGAYAWSWQGAETTSFEAKYDQDGFIFGVRYSQVGDPQNKGRSFAGNNILADKAECGFWAPSAEEDFFNMKAFGVDAVAVNLFTLLEGVEFDELGQITGLDAAFTENLATMMDVAVKNDLKVAITLQPALNELANGTAGASKTVWDKHTQMYHNETIRAQYIDLCVKPVLAVLKDYEQSLLYIAIVSQPEKDIAEIQGVSGTTWDKMVAFVDDVNAVCREVLPQVATTVETDAVYLSKFNAVELSAAGQDLYTDAGEATEKVEATSAFPLYLSRYGIKKGNSATEEFLMQKNVALLSSAIEKGYMGAFFDEWNSQMYTRTLYIDGGFRQWATTMFFTSQSYHNDRIENYDGNPVNMLYNLNDGKVRWLGDPMCDTYTVERAVVSEEGEGEIGEWAVIAKDLVQSDVDNGYFICTYTDDNREDGVKYCYRVINTAVDYEFVSTPTN